MILFHGSRALFNQFDEKFIGTGEGVNHGVGFMFTESLTGACRHAESYLRHVEGTPVVYVCEIHEPVMLLDRRRSIQDCGTSVVRKWQWTKIAKNIPVGDPHWFYALKERLSRLFALEEQFTGREIEDQDVYRWLGGQGFHALQGVEAPEPYLEGSSILVVNLAELRILERYETSSIRKSRAVSRGRRYSKAEVVQLFGECGEAHSLSATRMGHA